MNKAQRQSLMLDLLSRSGHPISGSELARTFHVSRQVIVKDIATLRDAGAPILSMSSGYMLSAAHRERILKCRHTDRDKLYEELFLIVENGGIVLDVIIDHPLYGAFATPLNIRTRRDVSIFTETLYGSGAQPISALTDGVHRHTVRALDDHALDAIEEALREAGILMKGEGTA